MGSKPVSYGDAFTRLPEEDGKKEEQHGFLLFFLTIYRFPVITVRGQFALKFVQLTP